MVPRRWNPGIDGDFQKGIADLQVRDHGILGICGGSWAKKSRSSLRWVRNSPNQMEIGRLGVLLRSGYRSRGSIIIKALHHKSEGIITGFNTESRLTLEVLILVLIQFVKLSYLILFGIIWDPLIVIDGIFGIKGSIFSGGNTCSWKCYKESFHFNSLHIILFSLLLFNTCGFILSLATSTMSQSQLIGSSGEMKNGEGARKRLKISVPHFNNSDLIKGYSKTLIGRCMNPAKQNIKYLVVTLPKIWSMEDRVVGTDLGLGRFQFDFDVEEDIETVLKMQPFHFDYWMISLVRWQPKKTNNYPSEITFWIKVLGVPLEFWEVPTFRSIGDALGETKDVDLDYGRVQVVVDGFKALTFETTVDFTGGEYYEGEEVPVSLRYEKLFGYCETCLSLCHKDDVCPLTVKNPEKAKEIGVEMEERVEDRARSYKGVVINGNGGQQDRGREHREDHGKGKGKMYEEHDSKWVRVGEKEPKKHHNRGGNRREEEGSRHRNSRREPTRTHHQEERSRAHSGLRSDRVARSEALRDVREEGEINDMEKASQGEGTEQDQTHPSQAFLAELKETQEPSSQTSGTLSGEQGTLAIQMGLEAGKTLVNDSGLESEDSIRLENEKIEEIQTLGDGETEGDANMQEAATEELNGERDVEEEDGKEKANGEVEKRQGGRRRLLKPVLATGTSTKLKMAQMMFNKRMAAKTGSRQGDHSKQVEEKGTSNPKPDPPKQ